MSASVQCGHMVSTGSDPWDWHRCPAKAKWWRPLREGKKRFACGRHKKKGFDWKPIAADQPTADRSAQQPNTQADVKPRYKNKDMRSLYERMLRLAEDKIQ